MDAFYGGVFSFNPKLPTFRGIWIGIPEIEIAKDAIPLNPVTKGGVLPGVYFSLLS